MDDDDWVTRAIAGTLAASAPGLWDVVGAVHSGEEAVAAFGAERPDVVLMDVNMPGIGGVEATRRIMASWPDARVVILTTIAPGPGLAHALEAGALAAVSKSAQPQRLLEVLDLARTGEKPQLLRGLLDDVWTSGLDMPDADAVAPSLTSSELRILRSLCQGQSIAEVAEQLHISALTVQTHVKSLRTKFGVKTLPQMLIRAMQYRFVTI